MNVYGEIKGTLSSPATIRGALATAPTIIGDLTIPKMLMPDIYEGPFTVTPSAQAQVLDTAEKYLTDSITVGPIPNNYGLITWDGSVITVS